MKLLLIVNFVFAGLFAICFGIFTLFTHGAFVNPVGLVMAGFLGWCVLAPMVMSAPALFLFNIYGVFKYWSKYKLMTLLPFLILGIAVMSLHVLDVGAMSIRRFEKYLPDYEAFVTKVEKEYKPGERNSMGMPKEYRHLGYMAIIYDDEPNNLYVMVEVGSFGIFGHTYFLHSSNGEIKRSSKGYRNWRHPERVNEHWFRISD